MKQDALTDDLAPFGDEYGPTLMGVYGPTGAERTLTDLALLHGAIPADLNGVYLRAGPNARYAPNGRYHPFDGDGMVHAAQFAKGTLNYRNRWVKTQGWLEEDAQGRSTHFGIRETLKDRPDKRLKDTANTDLVAHAGKVLALWYQSGDAYELDPITLETLGTSQAIVQSGGGISAHAKVDAATGEMMFFDYGNTAPYMHYGVVGPDGQLKHYVPIALAGPRLPHDMGISAHYSILHDLPLFHDEAALQLGRHKLAFHPELSTRFGVLPRFGNTQDVRWFDFSACFVYHVVNCWEDGDWVVQTGCRYMPHVDAAGHIDAVRTARDIAELVMHARLWVWRMNLKTGETEEHALDPDRNVEFPTHNTAMTGRRTRYAYLVDHSEHKTLQWHGIRKYGLDNGQCLSSWSDDPDHSWYSEPCFAEADTPTAEDHGYIICFQWNEKLSRQTLDIFDARDLSQGPLAQVAIPHRIPVGFHACWMATARMNHHITPSV